MDGFLVLRPATRQELSAKPPQYLLDELDRLMHMEEKSLSELVEYIDALPMELPTEIKNYVLAKDGASQEKKRVQAHRSP